MELLVRSGGANALRICVRFRAPPIVSNMVRWLKPGGRLLIQEADFDPTWTATLSELGGRDGAPFPISAQERRDKYLFPSKMRQ